MSIGIAVIVPDGIALAADTQTTWNAVITRAKEKGTNREFDLAEPIHIPIGWSQMAKKLFSLTFNGRKCALITAGAAQINQQTMYAIFKSAEKAYKGAGAFSEVVQFLVQHIQQQLANEFNCAQTELSKRPVKVCQFILAGYDGDVSMPVVESHTVFSGTLHDVASGKQNDSGHAPGWKNSSPNKYGAAWIGRQEFIDHIVNHRNPHLPPIQGQFSMMTLADAVEYARFLVQFVCDYQRFAIMVPDCGRPIMVASLTLDSYSENILAA